MGAFKNQVAFTRPNARGRVFRIALTPELPSKKRLAGNSEENLVFLPAKAILAGYFGSLCSFAT